MLWYDACIYFIPMKLSFNITYVYNCVIEYWLFGIIVDIYEELSEEVVKETVHLGLHRSDYMININKFGVEKPLQVEINTIASSFGCLSKKVGDFHRFMMQRNADSEAYKNLLLQTGDDPSLQVGYFFYLYSTSFFSMISSSNVIFNTWCDCQWNDVPNAKTSSTTQQYVCVKRTVTTAI